MHQQIRSVPKTSPPDLERFLRVLREANINLVAAGGGNLELGGEFAIVPAHDDSERAMQVLTDAGYHPRLLEADNGDFKLCWLSNTPGQLHECIADATTDNMRDGKVILDILVGVEVDDQGRIPVQVYSVEVKSVANRH